MQCPPAHRPRRAGLVDRIASLAIVPLDLMQLQSKSKVLQVIYIFFYRFATSGESIYGHQLLNK